MNPQLNIHKSTQSFQRGADQTPRNSDIPIKGESKVTLWDRASSSQARLTGSAPLPLRVCVRQLWTLIHPDRMTAPTARRLWSGRPRRTAWRPLKPETAFKNKGLRLNAATIKKNKATLDASWRRWHCQNEVKHNPQDYEEWTDFNLDVFITRNRQKKKEFYFEMSNRMSICNFNSN